MKCLVLPILAAAVTGCAVYPDSPPVATYPPSAIVYGSYYDGYPHYGYYDRYPYYDHRHGRNWRGHGRRDDKGDRRATDDDRKESTGGRSPTFDHDRSVLRGPDWKHGRSSRDSGNVQHGPDWMNGRSSRD